jgi:hypothetical protein
LAEFFDFFTGPDVSDVVASEFCAFAAAATVAAAVAPALVLAFALASVPALAFGPGEGAAPLADAFGSAAFGSALAVAAVAAFAACAAGAEGLPVFVFAVVIALEEGVPEAPVPDGGALPPFCAFAPEDVAPLAFPEGCCGPAVVVEMEFELSLFPLLSAWLPLPAEPVAGVWLCCCAGGGLAGGGGRLAGFDAPASSKAAKGCVSMFWLCADTSAGDGDVSETVAEALWILGTLGTLELREATLVMVCLQRAGQGRSLMKI